MDPPDDKKDRQALTYVTGELLDPLSGKQMHDLGRTIRSVYGGSRSLYGLYYCRNIGHRNTALS
jgi:hypothetical protein